LPRPPSSPPFPYTTLFRSRISSGFSHARMHPILKYTREHKGVDFAAPAGTKVRSSGDGVVEFVGQQRGYGNVIEIRHRNGISTLDRKSTRLNSSHVKSSYA